MADCCGGKNAGKPISWARYAAGFGVFVGYHGTVAAALHVAALRRPELERVRDFQWRVFTNELREVVALQDMNVGERGRLAWEASRGTPRVCETDVLTEVPGAANAA
jgi:hypothetical protein